MQEGDLDAEEGQAPGGEIEHQDGHGGHDDPGTQSLGHHDDPGLVEKEHDEEHGQGQGDGLQDDPVESRGIHRRDRTDKEAFCQSIEWRQHGRPGRLEGGDQHKYQSTNGPAPEKQGTGCQETDPRRTEHQHGQQQRLGDRTTGGHGAPVTGQDHFLVGKTLFAENRVAAFTIAEEAHDGYFSEMYMNSVDLPCATHPILHAQKIPHRQESFLYLSQQPHECHDLFHPRLHRLLPTTRDQ